MSPTFLSETQGALRLSIWLQPRASKNEIVGPLGAELKIKVTAPPVDSAANQALVEFLAKSLGCSRGAVQITRGQTSRHKVVEIAGIGADEALRRLGLGGSK